MEPCDVGSAQSQLAFTLDEVQAVGKCCLQSFDDGCCSVGRAVVDDQYVELFLQAEHGADDVLYVFFLVICRYDNDAVGSFHSRVIAVICIMYGQR